MTDKLTVIATDFNPLRRLRLEISGVALHERNGKHWAQPPSKAMVGDGQLIHGSDGHIRYVPILEFSDRETASAFSQACSQALEAYQQVVKEPCGGRCRRAFCMCGHQHRRL